MAKLKRIELAFSTFLGQVLTYLWVGFRSIDYLYKNHDASRTRSDACTEDGCCAWTYISAILDLNNFTIQKGRIIKRFDFIAESKYLITMLLGMLSGLHRWRPYVTSSGTLSSHPLFADMISFCRSGFLPSPKALQSSRRGCLCICNFYDFSERFSFPNKIDLKCQRSCLIILIAIQDSSSSISRIVFKSFKFSPNSVLMSTSLKIFVADTSSDSDDDESPRQSLSFDTMVQMNRMRENNEICNASIRTDGGKVFHVHRAILGASSEYFR